MLIICDFALKYSLNAQQVKILKIVSCKKNIFLFQERIDYNQSIKVIKESNK
jgi:hypothetical protein